MSSFLDIFSPLTGVMVIFKLGFIPKENELYELTSEQYQHYYATNEESDKHLDEKLYMILPENPQKYAEFAADKEVFIISEKDIASLKRAEEMIERYCEKSEEKLNNLEEKLYYCASLMPDVVSKGTKYERCKILEFPAPAQEQ